MSSSPSHQNPDFPKTVGSFLLRTKEWVSISEVLKLINPDPSPEDKAEGDSPRPNRLPRMRHRTTGKMIARHRLQEVLTHQKDHGRPIQEALVELGLAKEEEIVQELIMRYGFPYLPLSNYDVNPEAARLIPSQTAKRYCAIPIDRIGNNLSVVMANPLDKQAIKELEQVSGCTVLAFVSMASDIKKAIEKHCPSTSSTIEIKF